MSERQWNEETLQWETQDPESGEWLLDSPPLPEWAQQPAQSRHLVAHWQASAALSDVLRTFFWMSVSELLAQYHAINTALTENGYLPLDMLPLRPGQPPLPLPPVLSAADLAALHRDKTIRTPSDPEPAVSTDTPSDDDALDLTPTPPRPDEDPYRGVSPLSLAIPGYGQSDPLYEYYAAMGADKMRIRIKH